VWLALGFGGDRDGPSVVEVALARELEATAETAEEGGPAPPDPTGDGTLDNDRTAPGNNGGPNGDDGDRTAGNDGTNGGNNTYVPRAGGWGGGDGGDI